jgi:hypothetical protein
VYPYLLTVGQDLYYTNYDPLTPSGPSDGTYRLAPERGAAPELVLPGFAVRAIDGDIAYGIVNWGLSATESTTAAVGSASLASRTVVHRTQGLGGVGSIVPFGASVYVSVSAGGPVCHGRCGGLWRFSRDLASRAELAPFDGKPSRAAMAKDRLFVSLESDGFYALDRADTATKIWDRDLLSIASADDAICGYDRQQSSGAIVRIDASGTNDRRTIVHERSLAFALGGSCLYAVDSGENPALCATTR